MSFLFGNRLGDVANGVLVLALVGIAASGRMRRADAVEPAEDRHGAKVFVPALVIPAVALVGTLAFKHVPMLVDPKQATLVALTLGTVIALVLCGALLRARPAEPFVAGRGLIDDVGWVAVMPQMLASLGAVFALAGVGGVVGELVGAVIPAGSVIGAVLAYALGMALFTIVMGNAFAAFPVMAAAVGVPILIRQMGADPPSSRRWGCWRALRDADDAHGGELQSAARRAAGLEGQICGDPRAGADRATAARLQHPPALRNDRMTRLDRSSPNASPP